MGIIQQLIGPVPQAAAWFGMQLALMIVGALVARPTAIGRVALLLPMLACMVLPLLAPLPPLSRALLACLGMLAVLKLLQLGYEPRWAAHHPVWHGLSPFDVSTAKRTRSRFDARLLAMLVLHALLLAGAVVALVHLPAAHSPARDAWRLLLGAGFVYAAMETGTEGLRFAHRLFGVDVPPIQRVPVFSRSVGEFWSQRWNRPVSAWLNEYAFLPIARRRRPLLALAVAFGVSAAFHAWLYYAALGLRAAASAAAFFLLQAPIVMLEAKLRVARWPALPARVWTLAWLLGTSPLFVEPLLRGLGSR
jgi:hypothetical protein